MRRGAFLFTAEVDVGKPETLFQTKKKCVSAISVTPITDPVTEHLAASLNQKQGFNVIITIAPLPYLI